MMKMLSKPTTALGLVLLGFGILAAACGGGTGVATAASLDQKATEQGTPSGEAEESDSRSPEDEAAANIGSLVIADDPLDTQVLNTADGTVTTVRQQVTGDRPVLLWFWSPH